MITERIFRLPIPVEMKPRVRLIRSDWYGFSPWSAKVVIPAWMTNGPDELVRYTPVYGDVRHTWAAVDIILRGGTPL